MASFHSLIFFFLFCSSSSFSIVVTSARTTKHTPPEEKKLISSSSDEEEGQIHHYHTLQLTSLLPASVCNPTTAGTKRKGSLEVVHKHGPCSMFNEDMDKPLTVEEILIHDQSRVDSIKARLAINTKKQDPLGSKATLPAKSGSTVESGNYIVTVGLGTPEKKLSLIFDTGSDLTWTQCQPCAGSCYIQQEPIFAPSASTTYSNVSCTATECSDLTSATGNPPRCSTSTKACIYGTQYGDQSFSVGYYGKEKLTLTPKDVVNDFYFGCGQNNDGLFGKAAGLIGLGPNKISIVSQTAKKYGKVFSYCLPARSSSTGYLTFGSSGVAKSVKYTPLVTSQKGSNPYYDLTLTAITVGAKKLPISPTIFKTSGMIIDSGTVITRLPPTAYSALSNEFKAQMKKYPLTKPLSILDTCYDLSKYTTVTVPKINVLWGGNTNVEIAPQGILYANGLSQVCLAFAPNGDDSSIGIFGNVQQRTMEVVYNVAEGKVGFAPGGCS